MNTYRVTILGWQFTATAANATDALNAVTTRHPHLRGLPYSLACTHRVKPENATAFHDGLPDDFKLHR